jgi:uncharacterized protein Yka (UPF0111/DUF47 family)
LTAGANFQLAYRSNFLLPHRRSAWIRFRERLDETADFAAGVSAPDDLRVVLAGVETELRRLSASLGDHIEPV